MQFNPQQIQAIELTHKPCLVLAGAGSGKTSVIIAKIKFLILQKNIAGKNIAALTFTNKAALEMRERLNNSLKPEQIRGISVSTFHNLGLRILKKHAQLVNLRPNFSLFDSHDQQSLIKSLFPQAIEKAPQLISHIIQFISMAKNNMLDANMALSKAKTPQHQYLAKCYLAYEKQMQSYNAVDFDDLILLATKLLQIESVKSFWQNKLRYLLVDEYQDTNYCQYQLVKLLANDNNFTLVGDDDQSIYAWRGARVENIELLSLDYPDLAVIKLEQNYRSSKRILHTANILIENNQHTYLKKLFSEHQQGEKIDIIPCLNEKSEAKLIVDKIISHQKQHHTSFNDYAILYRSNHQSRQIEAQLTMNGINSRISGSSSFFDNIEIKDILAYLRLIANPNDDNALVRVINIPKRGIGTTTLKHLGELARKNGTSMFASIHNFELINQVKSKSYQALLNFANWIEELISEKKQNSVAVIDSFLAKLDYEQYLYSLGSSIGRVSYQYKNILTLSGWLKDMINGNENYKPLSFEDAVAKLCLRDLLSSEKNTDKQQNPAVELLTLHAAKGLEFPFVYLIGMEEGILPHQNSQSDADIQEERRLAYVGITRAQKHLTLSYCTHRYNYNEGEIKVSPSRFLHELPADDINWHKPHWQKSSEKHTIKANFNVK